MANHYKHGDWNVICDRSGFKAKASECRKTWDGKFVLRRFWEPRHPQDFVRTPTEDNQSVDPARPEPPWQFMPDPFVLDRHLVPVRAAAIAASGKKSVAENYMFDLLSESDAEVFVDPDNSSGLASDANDGLSRTTPWLRLPMDPAFAGTWTKATQRRIAVMGTGVVYQGDNSPMRVLSLNSYSGSVSDVYGIFPVDDDYFTIDGQLYPTGFSNTSGEVWEVTVDSAITDVTRIFIDNVSKGDSSASSIATVNAGDPFWYDDATDTLYVHSTHASGPEGDGTVSCCYEEGSFIEIARINASSYVYLQGIKFKGGRHCVRTVGTPSTNVVVFRCHAYNYYQTGFFTQSDTGPGALFEKIHIDRNMVSADTTAQTEGLGEGIYVDSDNNTVRYVTCASASHNVLVLRGESTLAEYVTATLPTDITHHCRLLAGYGTNSGLIARQMSVSGQSTASHFWGTDALYEYIDFTNCVDGEQSYDDDDSGGAFNFSNAGAGLGNQSINVVARNITVEGADNGIRFNGENGETLLPQTLQDVVARNCGRKTRAGARVAFWMDESNGPVDTQIISNAVVYSESGSVQIRRRDNAVVAVHHAPTDFTNITESTS